MNKRLPVPWCGEPYRPHRLRNDKEALTKAATSLLGWLCIFLLPKKLIHAVSLNTDRQTNRATVVRCVISATRNHLKLNMPGTLNPLLGNIHAETRKLRKRSAMRVAASRTDADHQSTNRPLPACLPRCLRHSRWLLGTQACPSARAGVALTIESGADTQSS
jgi:hypothetical protein